MGIKGLATQLHQYGRVRPVGRTAEEPNPSTVAIIDGPSLAYASFRHLPNPEETDDVLVSQWSYESLGSIAVAWVEKLKEYGVEIEGIYFDGALHPHKQPTREQRTAKSMKNLRDLKRYHDLAAKAAQSSGASESSESLLNSIKECQKTLAPPPFLVFAVLEALQQSKYAGVTWVVKGEADEFCAAAAVEASSREITDDILIFTNDSDLLIYNTGKQTRVVLINEIVESIGEHGRILQGLQFSPYELARMGSQPLPDLVRPAYEMDGASISFVQALQWSAVNKEGDEVFDKFAAQYSLLKPRSELEKMKQSRKQGYTTMTADSRISELIYSGLGKDDQTSNTGDRSINVDMYLPYLIEDPTRSSAWKIGVKLRYATESLVLYAGNYGDTLRELASSKPDYITNRPMERQGVAEIIWSRGIEISRELQQHSKLDIVNRWRFLVMQLTLKEIPEEQTKLPDLYTIVNVLQGTAPRTWRQTHLSAQNQAMFYSIRMLKQVLENLLPRVTLDDKRFEFLPHVSPILESMPGIPQFFDATANNVDQATWRSIIEESLGPDFIASSTNTETADTTEPIAAPETPEKSPKSKERRRQKKKLEVMSTVAEGVEGDEEDERDVNNPFSALSMS